MITDQRVPGMLTGVGVGPGDPELITLKAVRAIIAADVLCFLANKDGVSQAKDIAREAIRERKCPAEEIPFYVPMNKNRDGANREYHRGSLAIEAALAQGHNVVFLCEGDPLFFGSFAYVLSRLQPNYSCRVIPGISSVHAASATLQVPLTHQAESFAVVSGRHSEDFLIKALMQHDSLVVLKAGLARSKILAALSTTDRLDDACYLEAIGRKDQRIVTNVSALSLEPGPYFSLFVVTRTGRHRSLNVAALAQGGNF